MPFDRFLIAPINSGLQTDVRKWQIMDDAFSTLENAFVFRGRVIKRPGSQLMVQGAPPYQSQLRIDTGLTTNGSGAITNNIRTITGDSTLPLNVGQYFSIGTAIYTIVSATAGVQAMLATQGAGTFNISTGDFVITGAPINTEVYFYPGFPVMGLTQYESGAINNHPSYAFDTRYAYRFTPGTGWSRSGTGTSPLWHGNSLNYFWATNWKGATANVIAMFATNFQVTNPNGSATGTDDPIWVTQNGSTWTNFSTGTITTTAGAFVATARIIVPFRNRLVFLNTIENDGSGNLTSYPNRCRYSFNGSPFATNAWLEPNQTTGGTKAAGAGFIDATTDEAIISAEFIKDRLIVYFERSTWELAYTGNEVLPFIWQKLNTELGSQALLSTVPFDKEILTIGNTGVHSCNGSNVARIDNKIPDYIFTLNIQNNLSNRITGIRDYQYELVYWSVCINNELTDQNFTNQLLMYNYRNNTWATFDDCFTVYGYFEQQQSTTWQMATIPWYQANFAWNNGTQTNQRQILAGTPEGFVVVIDQDESRNAPAMYITNIVVNASNNTQLTIINHNFGNTDYILIENTQGITGLNGNIYQVFTVDANNIEIFDINGYANFTGTYTGGGNGTRVSIINILTKQFNPYDKEDRNVYIYKVDFAVDKTINGQVTVDYYPSTTQTSMINGGQITGSITGTNTLEMTPYALYPLESEQDLLWHPIYFQTYGESIQLVISLSEPQIFTPEIVLSDFELEAMLLYTQRLSQRLE
jgi:hypothetical protein